MKVKMESEEKEQDLTDSKLLNEQQRNLLRECLSIELSLSLSLSLSFAHTHTHISKLTCAHTHTHTHTCKHTITQKHV